jgi:hypothetical protein
MTAAHHNAIKTTCVRGHPLSGANLYVNTSHGRPMRQCRACRSVNRKADESQPLDPKALVRLRDAFEDGVPGELLMGRFGISHGELKAATAGLKREHVSGREP